jgi:hypothetical protein
MLYKVKVKGKLSSVTQRKKWQRFASVQRLIFTLRLGRKGVKSDIINGVEVTIIESI